MALSKGLDEFVREQLRNPEVAGGYLMEVLLPVTSADEAKTNKKLLADFLNYLIEEHGLKGKVSVV